MSIAINNYLAKSIDNTNFEPIKQYGIPVALLLIPPPIPIGINVYEKESFTGGGNDFYINNNTFDKMFYSVLVKKTNNKTRKNKSSFFHL